MTVHWLAPELESRLLCDVLIYCTMFFRPDVFKAVATDIEDTSNILFSSGTTGA